MQKHIRLLGIVLLITLPLCAVGGYFLYQSLSKELNEKIFQAKDSVPTRVYSRVWLLRRGDPISLKEIRARLAERDYREIQNDAPHIAGTFSIALSEASDAATGLVQIGAKEFAYPAPFRLYLEQTVADLALASPYFSFLVKEGRIQEIWVQAGTQKVSRQAVALEPVLVAQLSSGNTEARKAVPLEQIPHTLLEAIVSVEDQRFLEHSGIDPRGILRSVWANVKAGSYVQGASTITQQLIRNIYLTRSKTISRKLKEMAMAILIEMQYSKDQILEKYFNEVYFGQAGNIAVHGVSQAAKYYFNKSLKDLTIAEQALLAALVRGPHYYSPYRSFDRAKQRQELVLKKMLDSGIITANDFKTATTETLKLAPIPTVQDRAPFFTDMVKAQLIKELPEQAVIGSGFKIFSTVDTYYQNLAEEAVASGLLKLETAIRAAIKKKGQPEEELKLLQGAMIVIEPKSNQILAMVGGRSFAESNYNRVLLMKRQVGSIFKPFVYLAALIYGTDADGQPLNAISKLEDTPFTYEYDKQKWSPRNYEGEYLGTVTLKHSLINSLNVPTAKLALQIGVPVVIDLAKKAGIQSDIAPLPSVSLGTSELTPIEVAAAYSTIATIGVKRDLTSILMLFDEAEEDIAHFENHEEQALPLPETANIVQILRSVFEEGTAKQARQKGFAAPAAGKTGTTNEYRDAWFAGFTPDLLAVNWVGYDRDDEQVKKIRKKFRLTGATSALPIWTQFMQTATEGHGSSDFEFPSGTLKTARVDLLSGGLSTRECDNGNNSVDEVFTYNNAPKFLCPNGR
jgi:penicillin-binding protein 1B